MIDEGLSPVLNRLLGPGRPEVTCEVCFEELDRYVDLELAGEDAEAAVPGMGAHLRGCPACSEEHESLKALLQHHPIHDHQGHGRTIHDARDEQ